MTELIAHRVNQVQLLAEVPTNCGAEIDLRDRGERLILQHDPFIDGEDAEPFFAAYKHGTLILNIKSERIEEAVIKLLEKHSVSNYFFLDSSFPMIRKLTEAGNPNFAIRYSEYEGLDTVLAMKGKAKWVWVDCFSKFPLSKQNYLTLKQSGFQLCLVSPELQGRPEEISTYKEQIVMDGIEFDAICSKLQYHQQWQGDRL